jgi:hypothetical protein
MTQLQSFSSVMRLPAPTFCKQSMESISTKRGRIASSYRSPA